MKRKFDVVIVGGGIVGSCIATHLAENGLSACIVDTHKLGECATNAAAGLITPYQHQEFENKALGKLFHESLSYFIEFEKRIRDFLRVDLGFKQCGSLYLLLSNLEIRNKENQHNLINQFNPEITFLNKREVSKMETGITKEVVGAYHYPTEGVINNPKFLKAIQSYCQNQSVEIINSEVTKINRKNNKVSEVVLVNGDSLIGSKYVLSNGVWANKLLKQILDFEKDLIKPVKGEMIELELPGSYEQFAPEKLLFCNNGYILSRKPTNKYESCKILVGSTTEEIELDNGHKYCNTLTGVTSLISLFNNIMPVLNNSFMTGHWAGLRPRTVDELPIISNCEEVENLYFSLGHYRNGILMGPLTGKMMSDLIINEKPSEEVEQFNISRFNSYKANTQDIPEGIPKGRMEEFLL